MDEKEKAILEFMKDKSYVPMKAKEIAFILGVPKNRYNELIITLNKLEEELKIVKTKKNKYRINEEEILKGIYRRNSKGFGFVKVENGEEEIYISKEHSKNALNGDKVLVEIIEKGEKQKSSEGIIVKILNHEKNTLVGTFQNNKNFGFVVPDDLSFGTDIFIAKENFGKARNNHKVLVEIIRYPEKNKNAEGKIIEILGNPNEAGVDMLSIIKEYNLPSIFPDSVVQEAKNKGDKIVNIKINLGE